MARSLRLEYEGAIYHVTARGNERSRIFALRSDRLRFLEKLAESVETYHVRLYAYTLMTTHWHALVETPRGNVSAFMQQFNTSYTTYYNIRHQRVGHLYSGRYKARLVQGDEYLLRLARYIHLNPVRTDAMKNCLLAEKKKRLREYVWSSYRAYIGAAPREQWVDYGPLMAMITRGRGRREDEYRHYVEAGIGIEDEQLAKALKWSSKGVGDREFCRWVDIEMKRLAGRMGAPEDVAMRRVEVGVEPEDILVAVCCRCHVPESELRGMRKKSEARSLAMKLLIEYGGLTQREAGRTLGLRDGSGVSRAIRDFNKRINSDKRLARLYERTRADLSTNH